MARENRTKINHLFRATPKGVPLTTAWLQKHGISHKLAWWYVKSGWLEHVADGVYCFAGDKLTWVGAIAALQQQLVLPIYPAGKTALQLLGKGHYISNRIQDIQLFAPSRTKSPGWLQAPYWDVTLTLYRHALFNQDNEAWLATSEIDGQLLKLSSPEKASLELCHLVPKTVTFAEAALLMEALPRMRPKLLQSLLESCQSYKAKRLLLHFGDYFQHDWMHEIDLKTIDLGKGKRTIAGGGKYDIKYQLSVPTLGDNG